MSLSDQHYRVLFLLGVMRSGTTYFRNVLASNSNIRSLGSELNTFWTETGKAPSGSIPECKRMSADDATPDLCNSVRESFDAEYRHRNSPRQLAYRCYRKARFGNERILKHGRPFYLLNKSTHLLNKIDFLDRIFPNARYVFIMRDIYSQVFSMYRHLRTQTMQEKYDIRYPGNGECWSFTERGSNESSSGWSFADLPAYWIDMNSMVLKDLDRLTDRAEYVDYESLIRNPQTVLGQVADLIGVEQMNISINTKLVNNYSNAPLKSWEQGLSVEQKETIANTIREREGDYDFINSRFVGKNE